MAAKTSKTNTQDPSVIIKRMKDEARAEEAQKLSKESGIGGKFTTPKGMTPDQKKRYQKKLKSEETKRAGPAKTNKGEEYWKRHHVPPDLKIPRKA